MDLKELKILLGNNTGIDIGNYNKRLEYHLFSIFAAIFFPTNKTLL